MVSTLFHYNIYVVGTCTYIFTCRANLYLVECVCLCFCPQFLVIVSNARGTSENRFSEILCKTYTDYKSSATVHNCTNSTTSFEQENKSKQYIKKIKKKFYKRSNKNNEALKYLNIKIIFKYLIK